MNVNIKFPEEPFKVEGVLYGASKSMVIAVLDLVGFVNFKVLSRDDSEMMTTRQIVPCNTTHFKGIECLENTEQYGFQSLDHDERPSSRIWIDKVEVERLYALFRRVD